MGLENPMVNAYDTSLDGEIHCERCGKETENLYINEAETEIICVDCWEQTNDDEVWNKI